MSRGGLTFYFHLYSGHKIIFGLCRKSEHYKNVWNVQIITHNLASQKWSLRSRHRFHGTISPLLEFRLWAQCGFASNPQQKVYPQVTGAVLLKCAEEQTWLGRLHMKEYTVLWDVTCILEFPCKRRLKLLSVILRAHPYLAFSLSLPCFPHCELGSLGSTVIIKHLHMSPHLRVCF